MGIKVKLDDILMHLEMQSDETSSYLNKETGEVVMVMEEAFQAVEDDDDSLISFYGLEDEGVETARDILMDDKDIKYIALPSKSDIHEWEIMERFCLSVDDEDISESLTNAIHGRGAFRFFRDSIQRYGMEEQWYQFRDAAFKSIAVEWCKRNHIEYVEK